MKDMEGAILSQADNTIRVGLSDFRGVFHNERLCGSSIPSVKDEQEKML